MRIPKMLPAALAVLLLAACNRAPAPSADPAALIKVTGVAHRPADGAVIDLYRTGQDLRGPPFTRLGPLKEKADFAVDLPAGDYLFVVRQRTDGSETGPVKEGDLKSDPIPVKVEAGKPLDVHLLAYTKEGNAKETIGGPEQNWKTIIAGRITDPDGKPIQGVRIHAYEHVQMSERPRFVSAKTGPDGSYQMHLPSGGTYYLCARDNYGGPPRVGELYGRYDKGTVEPSAVILPDNAVQNGVDIVVHTVW